jgi:hypothetical protein
VGVRRRLRLGGGVGWADGRGGGASLWALYSSEALLLDRRYEPPVDEECSSRVMTNGPGSVDAENDCHIA